MRIHTSLTLSEMYAARLESGAPFHFEVLTSHTSRTHARAFEVRLSGSGTLANSGHYGAGDFDAATWDEWGAFFGALYERDQAARCGGTRNRPWYADADDYHLQTVDRFRPRALPDGRIVHLPEDTHKRHRWQADGDWKNLVCTKCTARRRTREV